MGQPAHKIVPEKPCAFCHQPFKPNCWKQYHNPNACCSKRHAMQLRHKLYPGYFKNIAATTSAINAMRRSRKRIELMVSWEFGKLTDREIKLFNEGAKYGRQKGNTSGYNRGYKDGLIDRRGKEKAA